MKPCQALAQTRFQVSLARQVDTLQANGFDHDVRSQHDGRGKLLCESSRVQQRNRTTVAMTEQVEALSPGIDAKRL